ncbi:hypothetical protein GJ699_25845 [Duganella sp. FT80W]|uniref:Uncharacterized protein n=1 Tax=Duganella guangzhouensis TaxID=2666084 RepID=A0A6I2L883_9BURK|nr:hypothetical protein [Duganella guangzhouensis]MRW93417.1 hypothetical protein [Duganella guangzhouensis]
MRNRHGLRAILVVLMLALVCRWGVAQIGPRYVIDASGNGNGGPAGTSSSTQGRVQPIGKGLLLISFQGLTLLAVDADAEAYSPELVRQWPAADLLLLTPASAGRYDGLAPLWALRDGLPVVVTEPAGGMPAGAAATTGGPRLYPLQVWNTLDLRKRGTRLHVTAMPGGSGTAAVAGYLLELGDSRASYRLYLGRSGVVEGAVQLAQRLPGADLALLPGREGALLLRLNRGAPKPVDPVALTATGYAFKAIRR